MVSTQQVRMLFLAGCWVVAAHAEAQDRPSFEKRLESLEADYSRQKKEIRQAASATKDVDRREELANQVIEVSRSFSRNALALAQEESESPDAPKALRAVIVIGKAGPQAEAAIDQLRRDWLLRPEVAIACLQIGSSSVPRAEALLRDILKQNPDRTARGLACWALALKLDGLSRVPSRVAEDEQLARRGEATYGREFLADLERRQPELASEAASLFERVVGEFADVKMYVEPQFDNGKVLGPSAQKWLDQHNELAVGKPAPAIDAKGLDGAKFKLSDYRGKVVVVDFWGSWCAPCLAMIPHERELVRRLEGKPFAFLGVNADRTEDAARAAVAKEQITWPNWYDGRQSEAGIAERYKVRSFPSIFVIDGSGIIRAKDVRGARLDEAVDKLLAEMAR